MTDHQVQRVRNLVQQAEPAGATAPRLLDSMITAGLVHSRQAGRAILNRAVETGVLVQPDGPLGRYRIPDSATTGPPATVPPRPTREPHNSGLRVLNGFHVDVTRDNLARFRVLLANTQGVHAQLEAASIQSTINDLEGQLADLGLEPEPSGNPAVVIDMKAAGWLTSFALAKLWEATEDPELGGCCPRCCGACAALARLADAGHLDALASLHPDVEWMNRRTMQVDRTWLCSAWRAGRNRCPNHRDDG